MEKEAWTMPERFELVAPYQATGDQPQAIEKLTKGVLSGMKEQSLLGEIGRAHV